MMRRSVDVRREQILTATIELIEKQGLANTRVSDVAGNLSISPALVFYHFETKDALLVGAFRHAVERDLERLDVALARGKDPLDRMRRVLQTYGPTGDATGWRMWIDAWAVAQREPAIATALRELDQRWTSVLRHVIDDGIATGQFRSADPGAAVARISALLDGLSVATLVYRSVSRADLEVWIANTVAAELGLDPEVLH